MRLLYSDLPPVSVAGREFVGRVLFITLLVMAAAVGALAGMFIVYTTDLPQVAELERYRPSAITELYDDQGRVFASFALQRRMMLAYEDLPQVLRDAVTAIEDKQFEQHWGVDLWRGLGAAYQDIKTRSRAQGASTLTMQLSRNLFLSPDRSFSRKLQEIMLAMQIERRFTKPQIFTMYANQIYLGHGVYGFEAGAQYYFGKRAKELTLAEAATLAALPKSPVQYSPVTNPQNARRRRNLVLDAMAEDGKITPAQAYAAKMSPLELDLGGKDNLVAPHFVEEVRQYLEKKYGSDGVHESGLKVYTTLNLEAQHAAEKAARAGLAAYERRQGWNQTRIRNIGANNIERYRHPDWSRPIEAGSLVHGVVTAVDRRAATVKLGRYGARFSAVDLAWTGQHSVKETFRPGDIVYVKVASEPGEHRWIRATLEQDSEAEVALLAIDNATGDIKAMVGGRDFARSKFNRATQALRQVGSSFKPYVYTAALDAEVIKPEQTVVDAPITFPSASGPYRPSNYDSRFWGTISLRAAVANSRNIPALKIANEVGIAVVAQTARKFGITSRLPEVLPLALGAAEVTLIEQTAAFTAFPNDGVRVAPRFIRRVTDRDGHLREETFTEVHDVISRETARTMVSLLEGVVRYGTATAALSLGHPVAGKTGTTNDYTDAWFAGFSPSITCGVWVGYDEKKTLGAKETGSETALPIWVEFMKATLAGREREKFTPPDGERTVPSELKAASKVAAVAPLKLPEAKPAIKTVNSRPPSL